MRGIASEISVCHGVGAMFAASGNYHHVGTLTEGKVSLRRWQRVLSEIEAVDMAFEVPSRSFNAGGLKVFWQKRTRLTCEFRW